MKYFPILLSKAGELTALSNLAQTVKDETSPVIQVLSENLNALEAHLIQHWTFAGNQVLLDFSLFEEIDDHIGSVTTFFDHLFAANVNVVPVVQQNSPNNYVRLVQTLIVTYNCRLCIRTSSQSGGFLNYSTQVTTMVSTLGTNSANTLLLLDLGYIEAHNSNTLAAVAILSIKSLLQQNNQWREIIVASGSFPENLNGLVPTHIYHLDRYEWHIWLLIQADNELNEVVKYGDYGTKNPIYEEVGYLGTSSIKYTTQDHFVIYRGELPQNNLRGMSQYIDQAAILITTPDYSGAAFSWGDGRINAIVTANNRPGNPRSWVEISQNHHISLLHSLL